jgi:hypothetical protein
MANSSGKTRFEIRLVGVAAGCYPPQKQPFSEHSQFSKRVWTLGAWHLYPAVW